MLIICLFAAIGYFKTEIVNVNSTVETLPTVIIDAGHGGFDGGASAKDGTVEKDINLQIALKTEKMLKINGYSVILTRSIDSGTEDDASQSILNRKKSDLANRLQIMSENSDAVFVSIHLNKFTTSAANGAQVFYTKNYKEAYILAQSIQKNIKLLLQPQNERVVKQGTDSTFLLKNATTPAVIVECGFLSNKLELERLKTDDYQSQMAFAIVKGIKDFYG